MSSSQYSTTTGSPTHISLTISSSVFGGFRTFVDVSTVTSIREIVATVKQRLIEALAFASLEMLELKARNTRFCIHGVSLEEIQAAPSGSMFYVCDHCFESHDDNDNVVG